MPAKKVDLEPTPLALDPEIRDQTLQILLNIPNDLILLLDPQGNLLLVNNTFLRLSGYQLQELVGKNLVDILPLPLAQARLEVIRRVAQTGQAERFEDSGVIGWYDNIVYPILDAQGQVVNIVVQARDISERKQVEVELQQSLATIRSLLEGPTDFAALYDIDGRVIICNETLGRFFDSTPGELIGQKIFERMLPELAATRRELFRKAVESGRPVRFQDFEQDRFYDHIVTPIQDPDGYIRRLAVLSRDITELHEAERAKQRSEALLKTVINNTPLALFALDKSARLILLEGHAINNLGYPAEKLAGRDVIEVCNRLYPEAVDAVQQALAGQKVQRTIKMKNGLTLDATFMPQIGADGAVDEIYGLALDVTERSRMFEELQQSRNQLAVILEGISDSVTVRDNDLHLIYANEAAAQLKGYASAREYMERGRPGEDFEIIDADGRFIRLEDYLHQRSASIRDGAPLEIRYRRPGSMHDHWIQMKTAPIRDESGAIQMTVFISRDITEQKRSFEDLSRSHNELNKRVNERTAELAAANQVLRNEVELRRQAEHELRIAVARAETLARIAANLNAQHDLHEIVQSVCEEALQISAYQTAGVFLYDEKTDSLYVAAAHGIGALDMMNGGPAPRTWFENLMADYDQMMIVHDASSLVDHPRYSRWVSRSTRTLVVVSMEHAGELIGALVVSSQDRPHFPNEEDQVLLRSVANLGATSIAKGLLFQQLDEARQRLQAMTRKLIDVQDGERRHLAMELHDQIGQLLTSLGLSMEQAERQAQASVHGGSADLAGVIADARQQTREVLNQVRELSLRLRPAMLDDLGLVPALLAHFERFSATTNIRVDFRHSGLYDRFPTAIENAVFRMIQESLTNVARYAGVQDVSVRLLAEEDLLVAQVRDQGIGFDPELRLTEHVSSGLSGMNERITLCGGQLTVESAPGQGACLTAEFPIGPHDRQAI